MSPPEAKKLKLGNSQEEFLEQFKSWSESKNVVISPKVSMTAEETVHRYAMVANTDIDANEILFKTPRKILLSENVNPTIVAANLESKSGWVKLVLTLMREYTNPDSNWQQYLQIVPSKETLDLPMYWSEEERNDLLKGTYLLDNVNEDLHYINEEFLNIALPFIKENKDEGFDLEKHNLELYKLMVGFIMAYSFTEEKADDEVNAPYMVPMADILNHISKNNAQLTYGEDYLIVITTQPIKKGEEVFNSYGHLSNWQLLQMYGFTEEHGCNIFDFVDIQASKFKSTALAMAEDDAFPDLHERIEYLFTEDGLLTEKESFAFGINGILTYEKLMIMMKVLTMSKEEFKTFNPEWDSDESEEESDNENEESDEDVLDCLMYEKLPKKLNAASLKLLRRVCSEMHDQLDKQVTYLNTLEISAKHPSTRRIKNVINLLNNQLMILRNVTNKTK